MIYPHNYEAKVGFDTVRGLLKKQCDSTLGRQRVDGMEFSDNRQDIETQLDATMEFVSILRDEEVFPDAGFHDMRDSLKRARIAGLFMEEREVGELRRTLEAVRDITRFLAREEVDQEKQTRRIPYPVLREMTGDVMVFPKVIGRINQMLDKFGKMMDNASPELFGIRRELARAAGSISGTLNRILRSAQSSGFVERDAAPTMRDGRLVIPVAPAMKRKIQGIVHDESATGKTVFIEPQEVVEANNRVRELEAEEKREISRILSDFTSELRPDIPGILDSLDFLAEIDFIRAKARFTVDTDGRKPVVDSRPSLWWTGACHPLLMFSLRKHGKKVVPLDIKINEKQRIVLISGPNAGGKSVCLKTVGLLQYMLQCGMPIPVGPDSGSGVFSGMFIDIGDEQSIEDDLSTYSSHLTNMKMTLRHADDRSLILIDEFGGGTEPQIGGAIAQAMLRRFNDRGVRGVITTHYQNLKTFAEDNEGIVNGAMLYDRHRMQALFRLETGNPGSSFAVEIARKIGLPNEVIDEAADIVGQDYINADKYLQDIARDKQYWNRKRQNIRQREKQLEKTVERYEQLVTSLYEDRKQIMREAKGEAERLLKASNARIENTIRHIKEAQAEKTETRKARQKLDEFKQDVEGEKRRNDDRISREMERLRARQERKKNRGKRREETAEKVAVKAVAKVREFKKGDVVKMKGQNGVGQIMELNGKNALVAFGIMKVNVKTDRLMHTDEPVRDVKNAKSTFISAQTRDNVYEKKLNFKQDIDVRGMRGQEAMQAVTYFIDDAILFQAGRVRILHGTGDGILRTLIREYLRGVNGVREFHDEDIRFGGAGITVVELD